MKTAAHSIAIATPAVRRSIGMVLVALSCILVVVSMLPSIPYNVRELFGSHARAVVAFALSVALLATFSPPVLVGSSIVDGPMRRALGSMAFLLLQALCVFLILLFSVPRESIHDIVGSPVWGLSAELELGIRFGALFLGVGVIASGAAAVLYAVVRAPRMSVLWRWAVLAVPLLLGCYWLVIVDAATDNLTELLRGGGSLPASIALATWLFLICLGAGAVSARIAGVLRGSVTVLAGAGLCLLLAFLALQVGLAPLIEKYGKSFSAQQFLFSPSRDQYLHGGRLQVAVLVGQLMIGVVLAAAQFPAWRVIRQRLPRPTRLVTAGRAGSSTRGKPTAAFAPRPEVASTLGAESSAGELQHPRRAFFVVLGLYVLFVVYGSLVPLEFHPIPFEAALARYRTIPFLDLGIGSRADWVANLLLFIPLAFLAMGVLWSDRSLARNLFSSLAIALLSFGFAVSLEFVQIFFPPRTVSQNDILAESLGAGVGIMFWWIFGVAFTRYALAFARVRGRTRVLDYYLGIYLGGIFVYALMPLDLTISPVELHDKIRSGRVNLVPFALASGDLATFLYGLAVDVALWIPVALLLVASGRSSRWSALGLTFVFAFVLEVAQLFVWSRITDVTDLVTALLGGSIGAFLGGKWLAKPVLGARPTLEHAWVPSAATLAILVLYASALLAMFWYPYEFRTDTEFLRGRVMLLERVPFYSYYFGSEYRAITELLRKVLMFLPLGLLAGMAWIWVPRRSLFRPPFLALLLALIIFTPLIVELGQLALPGKNPDLTDLVLEILGGLLGLAVVWVYRQRSSTAAPRGRSTRSARTGAERPTNVRVGPAAIDGRRLDGAASSPGGSDRPAPVSPSPETSFRTRWHEQADDAPI